MDDVRTLKNTSTMEMFKIINKCVKNFIMEKIFIR